MNGQAALLLLADSQLLFQPLQLPQLRRHFAGRAVHAAYVGAANGHQQAFFELACAALESQFEQAVVCDFIREGRDVVQCRPNLVILAGGSVEAGWQFLQQPDVQQWLTPIYQDAGALFVGVSAGAIHLAQGCDPEHPKPVPRHFLNWYPHFVAVHEEQQGWPSREIWEQGGSQGHFVGIPLGGGLWVQAGKVERLGRMMTG